MLRGLFLEIIIIASLKRQRVEWQVAGLKQEDITTGAPGSWKHSHLLLTVSSDHWGIVEGWETSGRRVFRADPQISEIPALITAEVGDASRSRGDGVYPPALQSDALLLFYTFCLFSLCSFFYCLFNVFYRLPDHLRLLHCHQRRISHMHRGWEAGARATQRFQLHPLVYSVS